MDKNINVLLTEYYQTKNQSLLSDILYLLGNTELWVPMSLKISPDEEKKHRKNTVYGQITLENERYLTPGYVRSGSKRFFPLFLSPEYAPKYYSDGYTWFSITLNKAAELTLKKSEVAGIVVNAFSTPFVITSITSDN